MPRTREEAINFLETQWSSINDNKLKGIHAEISFKSYLHENNVHYLPGGWILIPGKNVIAEIPPHEKICLLPVEYDFTWCGNTEALFETNVTPAQVSAYNYFRQLGVTTYFLFPNEINQDNFILPTKSEGTRRANYPKSYDLSFKTISPTGDFIEVPFTTVMSQFSPRKGNIGLRCYSQNRLNPINPPWDNTELVKSLFWFEYARYYCQINYLVSNNDLDLFLVGNSGKSYPVELKSKTPAHSQSLGDWFGIDIGPYAKMSFFTANSMNTDALYIVQEVDDDRNHIDWLGILFTDLVKSCFWVGQAGGTGMMGGDSSTIKIPKAAFVPLGNLLERI